MYKISSAESFRYLMPTIVRLQLCQMIIGLNYLSWTGVGIFTTAPGVMSEKILQASVGDFSDGFLSFKLWFCH